MSTRILSISFLLVLSFSCLKSTIKAQGSGIWTYVNNGNNCSNFGNSGSCCDGRHEASYVQSGDKFYLLGEDYAYIGNLIKSKMPVMQYNIYINLRKMHHLIYYKIV